MDILQQILYKSMFFYYNALNMIKFIEDFSQIEIKNPKALIVTDENVNKLYQLPFDYPKLVLPAGEKTKTLDTVAKIYEKCVEVGLSRSDCIIAFGGGVVGDIAGFAAATYMRGIDVVQVPTTIVAQCDSSIGGKTAVDLPEGKNLVGAFHLPKDIYINVNVLKTLPERVYSDGMAEVIKHAALADDSLFENLGKISKIDEEIIKRNTEIKSFFVDGDLTDKDKRMMLNFGHTFGHAIEKYFNYERYTHGEAVSIGMMEITKISTKAGVTEEGTLEKLEMLLSSWGLPRSIDWGVNLQDIIALMKNDKKVFDDFLNVIVLEKIGKPVFWRLPLESLGAHFAY